MAISAGTSADTAAARRFRVRQRAGRLPIVTVALVDAMPGAGAGLEWARTKRCIGGDACRFGVHKPLGFGLLGVDHSLIVRSAIGLAGVRSTDAKHGGAFVF